MRPSLSAIQAVLIAAGCLSASAQGEAGTGSLVGVVRDRSGAVVTGGTLEIQGPDSQSPASTLSDAQGRYAFRRLRPGSYAISAVAPGFERSRRDGIVVGAGAESTADLTLDVARRLAFVEVTAAPLRPLAIETDPRAPRQPIPAHDGADYLKTVPGFAVIRKGGSDGDPVLRGMAGSRLGVLLDGEHILGGCGNRMDPPTAYAFPEAYDRITVLKGPQTVLHGPGNSAGVVLFEHEPGQPAEPRLRAYAAPAIGSFGRNDELAEVRAGSPHAYVRASATRSAMDNYQDGGGQAVHARYERWSANTAIGWTPGEATRLELSAARSDGEAAYADRMMDGVRFSRENLGLRFERRGLSKTLQSLEGRFFYNYVDHVMDNYSLRPFTRTTMMPSPSASNPDRRTRGARASARLGLGATTRATIGADWQDNRHSLRGSSNQTSDPFEGHVRLRDADFANVGAFVELTQAAGSKALVVAGARVDRWAAHDSRQLLAIGTGAKPSSTNPTAGARRRETLPSGFARYEHRVGPAATLYAGVGHTERAPDYWELIGKERVDSLSAFETRREKTTQLDAGLLCRRGSISGSASLFVSEIADFILIQGNYPKPAAPMGAGAMGSAGMPGTPVGRTATISRNVDASTWGGEVTLAFSATERLKLEGSLAYVRGQNRTDDRPLAQLPPFEGRFGLQYRTDRWSLGALGRLVARQNRYALGQGSIVGQDLGPTAGFAVFSLNGTFGVTTRARLAAGVDNLLDRTYAEFVSRAAADVPGFATTTRVNEPGRTLWVKLDFRY